MAVVAGTIYDDTILGTASADVLRGDAGEDTLNGLGGDGALSGGPGHDLIIGGEGSDTVHADGRLVFDAEDPAARAARLHEAALDRLPDQGGLNFWINAVQHGQPFSALAAGFTASAEFQPRFGGATADDGAFVDRLHQNVLGRAGEAEGRRRPEREPGAVRRLLRLSARSPRVSPAGRGRGAPPRPSARRRRG